MWTYHTATVQKGEGETRFFSGAFHDLNHVTHFAFRFRNPKRFMAIPAPLPCIEWWRVCLDEAQMIECTTTKTAEMALRLAAVNRWAVTGTPIEKSLNDIQGLLMFLKVLNHLQSF